MSFLYGKTEKKVSDVCKDYNKELLIVDESYQRRGTVWNNIDKIRLIETILLGYIIPELYFWDSETDPTDGTTITHIVDGQQRVKTLVEFTTGELTLLSEGFIDVEMKKKYGGKNFNDLTSDEKNYVWNYPLSIILLQTTNKEQIKTMFYRLNLTNYSLNGQEKRNSKYNGKFVELTKEILSNTVWSEYDLFTYADSKRMGDLEFCANLILLAKKGIIDQTTQKTLNQAYQDYSKNYDDLEKDKTKISNWINMLIELINKDSLNFFRKKTQLYTTFCLISYLYDHNIQITEKIKKNFDIFIQKYSEFSNNSNTTDKLSENENNIQAYKLAASEGVNKLKNRQIRFDILKKIVLNGIL